MAVILGINLSDWKTFQTFWAFQSASERWNGMEPVTSFGSWANFFPWHCTIYKYPLFKFAFFRLFSFRDLEPLGISTKILWWSHDLFMIVALTRDWGLPCLTFLHQKHGRILGFMLRFMPKTINPPHKKLLRVWSYLKTANSSPKSNSISLTSSDTISFFIFGSFLFFTPSHFRK